MKPAILRCLLISCSLMTIFTESARAQNFVYVNNNTAGPNTVSAFAVSPTGTLSLIGTFPTGGSGRGGGSFAADRASTCAAGNRLYVVNPASSDVTGFDIDPNTGILALIPGSPFPTGGATDTNGGSVECTPDGRFLIVANSDSNNLTVFSIGSNGSLTPVPGSPFPAGGLTPNDIEVSPDGRLLAVALVGNDRLAVFSLGANGVLTPVPGSPFPAPAAGSIAGIDINCTNSLLFAGEGVLGSSSLGVYGIQPDGSLVFLGAMTGGGLNSNVVVLSPDDRFLFVSNQLSNTITVFSVAPDGTLAEVIGSPFDNPGGSEPLQMATDQAGRFLYVNNTNGTLSVFGIGSNGALMPAAGSALPVGSSPAPGVAAFPPAGCLNTPPISIDCPPAVTVMAVENLCPATPCAVVNFTVTSSGGSAGATVICSPASGSIFPVGTTTVTCTAADSSGDTASCSFTVTVVTAFDVCLQDESNGSLLRVNSVTGDYQFNICGTEVVVVGRGTITVKGSVITLQHNTADRRVLVKIDGSTKRATGSIQVFSLKRTFTIIDRNILEGACSCR
ncbi:MAG TPA: beta-propeller fold lactonase family protein [Blastocatellia bacterium]|nr:beta-propeller fold lactonase family protein [Blastocatellia bacterium]